MHQNLHPFSCFIIGEGSLLIQCADILLQHKHHIDGIISANSDVRQWTHQNNLPLHNPTDDLLSLLGQKPFDYLFSIDNGYILPKEVLSLPSKYAINYHDAPLPKYAGMYATSWAIMNHEVQHGITWHVMTQKIDAGDILKQQSVLIHPQDTAFTLNAKCCDAAIAAFTELIDDLAHHHHTPWPQNLAERTYFPLYSRPSAGGVMAWQQSAEDIDARYRALSFGPASNYLGLPKLALGQAFYIIAELELGKPTVTTPPGTLLSIDDGLTVATTTRDVTIKKLLAIDGSPLSITDIANQHRLQVGKPLPNLAPAVADHLTARNGQICKHESFWVDRLATHQPVELPYRKQPAPDATSGKGAHAPLAIPDEVASFLNQRNWAPEGFLLSVLAVYLTRLSQIDCFDLGFKPVDLAQDISGLEAFFASQVPLRINLDPTGSFEQVYHAIQTQVALTTQHQTYARDIVARYPELRSKPELQHFPPMSQTVAQIDGLAEARLSANGGFTLYLTRQGVENVSAILAYHTHLFEHDAMDRMVGHLQTLFRAVVAAPAQPISTLPLLTDAERQQLLVEWNDTETDFPKDTCIHHLFEAQAERTPDAIAVTLPPLTLTYQELNERATQLAHYLRSQGVGPETLVGLLVERSPDAMVGILGTLKAGGAYLPLDSSHPQDRLAWMLADSQVTVLLTQQRLAERLPEHQAHTVCLDTDWPDIAMSPVTALMDGPTSEHLAYVIYTSGSTGEPKGVMVTHRSLVNACQAWLNAYAFNPTDCVLQTASFAFDVFAAEWIQALCFGGKLVICPQAYVLVPDQLYHFMQAEAVNFASFVPAIMRHLVQYLSETDQALAFLRLLIIGADSWYNREYTALQRFCGPETRMVNAYGVTEATVDSSYFEADVSDLPESDPVPIGRPMGNMQLYILDEHLQPVPIGVPGELHIGGEGVARGYLNQSELTRERFIPNPFGVGRLYKTGDLARYLPDGNIAFLGRADDQVKLRGFRVELGEIETALSQHAAVQDNVVIAREDQPGEKRLVAYIVTDDQVATPSAWRKHLQKTLPDYMVPAAFVVLDALPLTPNGKVDRRALPAPSAADIETPYVAPRTPTEDILSSIWADVLRVERVGRHDNFFDLGGHSLLATQVVSRLRDLLQVNLPVGSVFEAATIAELALAVETAHQAPSLPVAPPIRAVERSGDLPLSFAQQRLWFLDQLQGPSPTYNLPEAYRLIGILQVTVLEQALNALVQRHEVLRTAFPSVEGQPVQRIHSDLPLPLLVVDLRHLAESEQTAELNHMLSQAARQPFDLAQLPLVRVTLYELSDHEHILLVNIHHIIADAWSMEVWWRDLNALYQALLEGQPAPLFELPLQYADFAQWQRQWLTDDVLAIQRAYWQRHLSDAPVRLELPTDHTRPSVQTFNGQGERFELAAELTEQLRTLSRQRGSSLFMTLYSAFALLLSRYSGQEDLIIGTPIANRHHAEVEPLIGFFVNTLALRADLSGNPSFEDLLKRVRQVTLEAHTHQEIPFEQLVDELALERHLSHAPLFQVMFAIEMSPEPMRLGEVQVTPLRLEMVTAKFDLTLFLGEVESMSNGGLWGMLEYNTDLFEPTTISRMIGHFQQLLGGIVADPKQSINTLPLLTEAERQQLLVEWNDTQTAYPHDLSIPQLFEAQAERDPNAVAVVFGDQRLTYQELNAQANQLAHHLQARGVGPEAIVAICMQRSPEMVVGLLAILKAGGAYLPLDPDYPPERLAFMLDDANVPVLLTQEHLRSRLPQTQAQLVCLDTHWAHIATQRPNNLSAPPQPDHLAYVIYTSGSTGKPKGVRVPHRAICRLVCNTNYIELSPKDRMAQASNASFDAATFELWGALLHGATLVGIPREVTLEPQEFADYLQRHEISVLFLTTALFNQIVRAVPHAFQNLRHLLFGGEAVEPSTVRAVLEHGPPERLLHVYGPTENTTFATWYLVEAVPEDASTVPIGSPVSNTQLYVLDAQLEPVPVGVPGELYIGGAGLAHGYHQRLELTRAKFITNPFGSGCLYKTGDLVRYQPEGAIEFLGRVDDQVKLRGYRIELGEIEVVLSHHPDVQTSVVVVREEPVGQKHLVAYVVPGEPSPASSFIAELRDHLKQTLPTYMVPSAFVLLDHVPLTPNGKVDRRALPAPERIGLQDAYVPPRTPTEEALVAIWIAVLGVERVGVHDNFFDLGGHSLLATQVMSRTQAAFQLDLPVRDLFESPTIAELAERIDDDEIASKLRDLSDTTEDVQEFVI